MTSWVLFFMIVGKYPTSVINVEFTTSQQCEYARHRLAAIIPSEKDGYFKFSTCLEKL